MQCLPKNGVPEKYCEANFLGEGETNEAIFKGSARKPLSLAKFVWTRVSDIIIAGNISPQDCMASTEGCMESTQRVVCYQADESMHGYAVITYACGNYIQPLCG